MSQIDKNLLLIFLSKSKTILPIVNIDIYPEIAKKLTVFDFFNKVKINADILLLDFEWFAKIKKICLKLEN